MNRFVVSLRAWWKSLTDGETAKRVADALQGEATGPDLRVLALLQRDGRLIDFLQEDIAAYSDDQIGAAVRDIHRGCRAALAEYLVIEPVLRHQEGDPVTVGPEFDPSAIRLLGNVTGSPPFRGTLKHPGWRVARASLPGPPPSGEPVVLAPAEVELS